MSAEANAAALSRRLSSGGSNFDAVTRVALDAIGRVETLERALFPFAAAGLAMGLCPETPAGGIWHTVPGTGLMTLVPCDVVFAVALDVLGRESTRQKVESTLTSR